MITKQIAQVNTSKQYLDPLKFLDKPWCIFTAVQRRKR